MALGENIRSWREKKGWTTHRLAQESGTNQSSVSRFESNKTRPRQETIRKIASALGAEVAQLEYGSDDFDVVPIGKRRIPILDYFEIGKWNGATANFPEDKMNNFTLTNAEFSVSAFSTGVRDDSMLPEFRQGDFVTVDPAVSPGPGSYVVATDSEAKPVIRQYKSVGLDGKRNHVFELRPLNDLYPTLKSDLDTIRIIGTIVEVSRRLHKM